MDFLLAFVASMDGPASLLKVWPSGKNSFGYGLWWGIYLGRQPVLHGPSHLFL